MDICLYFVTAALFSVRAYSLDLRRQSDHPMHRDGDFLRNDTVSGDDEASMSSFLSFWPLVFNSSGIQPINNVFRKLVPREFCFGGNCGKFKCCDLSHQICGNGTYACDAIITITIFPTITSTATVEVTETSTITSTKTQYSTDTLTSTSISIAQETQVSIPNRG
jgi:hypothetical protein